MKIIKKGKTKAEDIFRGTCYYCNSEMEAKRSEFDRTECDQRDSSEFGRAVCPVCKETFVLYKVVMR